MTTPVSTDDHTGAITWMAKNPVAANLLMIVLLVGGLVMAFGIKQEVFPDFEVGAVSVSVIYPGAGPEEVERGVVLAIEEAVQGLDGIDEMHATAGEGFGRVTIEVRPGMDVRSFAQEVESEVNAITSFPDEAERPMTAVVARKRHVISHAIYGDLSRAVLTQIAENFRDMLLQDPLITQVELEGTRDYEIHVSVPQASLRRYGLTLAGVAERIRSLSVELPGGSVKTRGGEIMVRMKERRDLADAYAGLPIITAKDGAQVLLEDIADISEGFEETNRYATFNGKPAIRVEVFRVGDQKPIEVAKAARNRAEIFQETLPPGIGVSMISDRSQVFEQRAGLLMKNGYIGLALVFILLALFLEIRLAFWVSLGIPISILGSFVFLPMTDFSINVISMFAFIVTLGIVVDDAIVVGENIYYYREQGKKFLDAAIRGAKDMAVPVVFSILTNIAAFLPIMFVSGTMGKIFKVIPLVVIMVFLISLVECLFILPAHLSHENRPPGKILGWVISRQRRISQGLTWLVKQVYTPVLQSLVKNRYITAALGVAVLAVMVGYVQSGRITTTLMPRIESDYAFVTVTLPYGISDEKTAAVRRIITDAAEKVVTDNGGAKLSRGRYTRVDENVITSQILLTPPDIRPMSTAEVTRLWREASGAVPGLESIVFQSDRGGPGSGASLTIELSHRDIDTLDAASMMLADELADFPSTKDIDDGSAQGKKQFDFAMKPQGLSLGLGARDVALQVRHAYYGATALKFQRGRNEVTVKVRLPEAERDSENSLETLMIYTPDGRETLLTDVVSMTPGRAFTAIVRRDGRRVSTVTADVVPQQETGRILAVVKTDILPRLQQQFPGLTAGFEGRQASMQESTQSLFRGLILALFGIYALLAIPFKSYFQPMIIMACIPFGIVGAVLGHILLGFSLSLMSLFGLVALSGVVVNGSLVMVDSANKHRRSGKPALTAITMSAAQRFRPIMLTTLTTFGGLSPMIFETSRQAQYLIPMAISLGFGIVFATLITLALVPCFYMILEDVLGWFIQKEDRL
jgi:multidrug efflux pump subunit AcrB